MCPFLTELLSPLFVCAQALLCLVYFSRSPNHLPPTSSRARSRLPRCSLTPQVNHGILFQHLFEIIVENERRLSVITCLCCSHEWGAGAVSQRARATCLQILRGNFQTTVSSWPELAWAHAHPSPSMFLPPVCRTWMIPPRTMLWRRWKITPWRAWRRWEPLACRCQLIWAASASQTHR